MTQRSIKSAERTLRLFELFSRRQERLTVSEIAHAFHMAALEPDFVNNDNLTAATANADLITETMEISRASGHPIATDEVARILDLPR